MYDLIDFIGAAISIGLVGVICSVFVYVIDKISDDGYVSKKKRVLKNKGMSQKV